MAQATPKLGFISAVHSLQGTLYLRQSDDDYYYHCHAYPSGKPKIDEPKWLLFREDKTTGNLTLPVDGDGNVIYGFSNLVDDVTNLTYFDPTAV